MRRLLLSIVVVFSVGFAAAAQQYNCDGVSDLFRDFKYCKKAEYVHVPKLLLKVVSALVKDDDPEVKKVLKVISSVRTLDLEACSPDVKQQFLQRVKKLKTNGYEEIVRQKTSDEHTLVMVKTKKDYIRQLVVVSCDGEDCALVQIKGKIRPEDVEEIIENKKKISAKR